MAEMSWARLPEAMSTVRWVSSQASAGIGSVLTVAPSTRMPTFASVGSELTSEVSDLRAASIVGVPVPSSEAIEPEASRTTASSSPCRSCTAAPRRGLLRDYGSLPQAWVLPAIGQLLEALHVIHSAGLVHRDGSPPTSCCARAARRTSSSRTPARRHPSRSPGSRGRPVFLSLEPGCQEAEPRLARVTQVIGTPDHVSPGARYGADPEPAQDLYAVGVVLIELLTGPARARTARPLSRTGSRAPRWGPSWRIFWPTSPGAPPARPRPGRSSPPSCRRPPSTSPSRSSTRSDPCWGVGRAPARGQERRRGAPRAGPGRRRRRDRGQPPAGPRADQPLARPVVRSPRMGDRRHGPARARLARPRRGPCSRRAGPGRSRRARSRCVGPGRPGRSGPRRLRRGAEPRARGLPAGGRGRCAVHPRGGRPDPGRGTARCRDLLQIGVEWLAWSLPRKSACSRPLSTGPAVRCVQAVRAGAGAEPVRAGPPAGISAPMLSQLINARRIKIANPVAAARLTRMVSLADEVRTGLLTAADAIGREADGVSEIPVATLIRSLPRTTASQVQEALPCDGRSPGLLARRRAHPSGQPRDRRTAPGLRRGTARPGGGLRPRPRARLSGRRGAWSRPSAARRTPRLSGRLLDPAPPVA